MSEVFQSELDKLLADKAEGQSLIENADAVIRLYKNKDFKRLILEGFMRDEASRFVQVSTDPNLGPQERADALGLAQASGYLKRYFTAIETQAGHARRTMVELDEAIEEARREELAS